MPVSKSTTTPANTTATDESIELTDTPEDDFDTPEDEFSDLDALAESLGLDFAQESRPSIVRARAPRAPRPEVEWERLLEGVKLTAFDPTTMEYTGNPGADIRIKEFTGDTAKGKAKSLARQVRSRLFTAVPLELWDVAARERTGEGVPANTHAVYVRFERPLTAEESAERIAKAQATAERLATARQSIDSTDVASLPTSPTGEDGTE